MKIKDSNIEYLEEEMEVSKKGLDDDIFEKHQLKIAKDTLKLSDIGAMLMGGMTKVEARNFLRKQGYSEKYIQKLENV